MRLITDAFALVLLLALFTAQLPATIAASYCVGGLAAVAAGWRFEVTRTQLLLYVATATVLLVPTLTFNHGVTPLFYLLLTPLLVLFAVEFAKNPLDHIVAALRILFWAFVAFIGWSLWAHWGEPEPLGAVLPWVSTNGIPSYLIVVQIAYSIAYYLRDDRLPIASTVATLAVAVFGLGRGSMVVAALIFVLSTLLNLTVMRAGPARTFARLAAVVAILSILFVFRDRARAVNDAVDIWVEGSKFSSGLLDEHRGRILKDYVGKIDGVSLVLGASYENTSINGYYGGNPHNSFIRVHSFYGLAALLGLFAPLVGVLLSRTDGVQRFVVCALVSLALLRATTEPIFFPSTLDFFYVLYFALFFRFAKAGARLLPRSASEPRFG